MLPAFIILTVDAVLYAALTITSIIFFVDVIRSTARSANWSTQRLFHLLILVAVSGTVPSERFFHVFIAKTVLYAALAIEETADDSFNQYWRIIFTTSPDLVIFAAFGLLLVFLYASYYF